MISERFQSISAQFANGNPNMFKTINQALIAAYGRSAATTAIELEIDAIKKQLLGWQKIGAGSDDGEILSWEERQTAKQETNRAATLTPLVIAGVRGLTTLVWSRVPTFSVAWARTIIKAPHNKRVTGYRGLVNFGRKMLTDGFVSVRIGFDPNDNTVTGVHLMDQKMHELNPKQNIRSPRDHDVTWLHYRSIMQTPENGTKPVQHVIYHRDLSFFPDEPTRALIEQQIKSKHGVGSGVIVLVDWATAIFADDLNYGVPLAYPAVPWAKMCLEKAVQYELAKHVAISSMPSHYTVNSKRDVDNVVNQIEQIEIDRERTERIAASTMVGTGKAETLNMNIAMLQMNAALVGLVLQFVYCVFSGLRPQAFGTSEASGIGNGGLARNQQSVWAAQYQQKEVADIINDLFVGIAQNVAIEGVTIEPTGVAQNGYQWELRTPMHTPEGATEATPIEVQANYPPIESKDIKTFMDGLLSLINVGGTSPLLGRPALFVELALQVLDVQSQAWVDYVELISDLEWSDIQGDQLPLNPPSDAAVETISTLVQFIKESQTNE